MPNQTAPIGAIHGVFLVVASMLGTGIMTTTGLIAKTLPSPGANLAVWICGGAFALLGAYCYGIIIAHHPRSGGEAGIFSRFYSRQLGDVTGLLSFFVGFGAANAATALALGAYLASGLRWAGSEAGWLSPQALAIGAIVLMTAVHSTPGQRGLGLQTAVAMLKLALLLVITLAGLGFAGTANFAGWGTTLSQPASADVPPLSSAFLWVVFAYSGWNAAIYSAGEFADARRTVPRAMLAGTALVTLLYIALNVALLSAFPYAEIVGVIPVVAKLAESVFSSQIAGIFSLLVGIALLSSIGASCFTGPRVLQAVLDRQAGASSPDRPPALWMIWAQAITSILLILTGTFEQILSILGLFLGIFPILAVFSLYRSQHWEHNPPPRFARFVAAPIFLTASVLIVLISTWQQPQTSLFVWGMIASFVAWQHLRERTRNPAQQQAT